MEQITNEVRSRIFAAYIFTQFRYDGSTGTIREIGGISHGWDVIDKENGETYKTQKCCLVLKPLSEISYRDATGVARIIYEREPSEQQLKATYQFIGTITHPHTDVFELSGACWIKIIDFLRSNGYDCGYGEIPSLIDAGIAIIAPNDERSVATK